MLNPNERQIYLEALRPPVGYTLDKGIATTFSLDLLTLLIIPLSLVLFDYEGEDDLRDQIKILEALQRTAQRITIYCQRGQIHVPRVNSLLYSYLEKTVVEIDTPAGVFHPKTWLLRFVAPGKPALYRFLCLSRNLTFDKSWDTMLVLDGEPCDFVQESNRPLLDFVRSLPLMATGPAGGLDDLLDELNKVRFYPPPGFEQHITFWPLGFGGYRDNPLLTKAERMLIISPFVTDDLLALVAGATGARCALLSRIESLDALKQDTLSHFERVYVMDDAAADEASEEGGAEESAQNGSDLHAKLYLAEQGNVTRVWTGSANATGAAFSVNVEFLVEMRANRATLSIDSILSPEHNPLGNVIREYRRSEQPTIDPTRLEMETAIDDVRRQIAAGKFQLEASSGTQERTYDLILSLEGDALRLPDGAEVCCWPITLPDSSARNLLELECGNVQFSGLTAAAVTAFMAFAITVHKHKSRSGTRFVLNLPLSGMPEDRNERVLTSIISDRNRFLRYLMLLLSEAENWQLELSEFVRSQQNRVFGKAADGGNPMHGIPLLEEMIRALSRDPAKIDRIARLVEEMKKTEEGREILPDEFERIWMPFSQARRKLVNN